MGCGGLMQIGVRVLRFVFEYDSLNLNLFVEYGRCQSPIAFEFEFEYGLWRFTADRRSRLISRG